MADAKAKAGLPEVQEVESNHNSLKAPAPVAVAFLAERGDYNPMRRTPNKANVASDTTHVRDTADELVEAKGDRPYRATVEAASATVAETSNMPEGLRDAAMKVSTEAAAEPHVYRDRLPAEAVVPAAEDSGQGG